MKVYVLAFTHKGACLCLRLTESLNGIADFHATGFAKEEIQGLSRLETDVRSFAKEMFSDCDALVFIGAAGIAVRAIAPYVKAKDVDPAVIVIDEMARHVIPILSGHIGGANRLARLIADILGAEAVITTATDLNGSFAVDEWAMKNNCGVLNPGAIKIISSAILDGRTVGFCSDFPIYGEYPQGVEKSESGEIGIAVSINSRKNPFEHTLTIVPRCVAVGIGCRKDIAFDVLEKRFLDTLATIYLPVCAVKCIATINLKSREEALLSLCRKYKLVLETYTPQELSEVKGEFSGSDFVKATTGVDNVCERAAVKSAAGILIMGKSSGDGVTVAVAKSDWSGKF